MTQEEKIYFGVDWGTVRIGLALGDDVSKIASPFCVVANFEELLEKIKELDVDELVVGQPVKMSGQTKNLTEGFEDFVDNLKRTTGLPVHLIDERLSSKAADALPGTKKTKASRDSLAAMIILQSFFDRM